MAKKKLIKISLGSAEKVREIAAKLGRSESFVWNALAGRSNSKGSEACVEYAKKNYDYREVTISY